MRIDVPRSTDPDDTETEFRPELLRFLPRMLLVAGVVAGLCFGMLQVFPAGYESAVRLAVVPVEAEAEVPDTAITRRMEQVRSAEFLAALVEAESLRTEPEFQSAGFPPLDFLARLAGGGGAGKSLADTATQELSERVTARRLGDSAMFDVIVRARDPALAARLANSAASILVRQRGAELLKAAREGAARLQREVDAQREIVNAAEAAVTAVRLDQGLFEGMDAATVSDERISSLTARIVEAQQRGAAAQARADAIGTLLANGQQLDRSSDLQQSVALQRLLQSRAELQAELAEKTTTLLANHPTIKALKAQIGVLDSQIAAEARQAMAALQLEANAAAELEQQLRRDLADIVGTRADTAEQGVTLQGLEAEAQMQRDLLEGSLARLSQAAAVAVQLDLRVVAAAEPATTPSRPADVLLAGLVGAAALLFQAGVLLLRPLTVKDEMVLIAPEARNAGDDDVLSAAELADAGADDIAVVEDDGFIPEEAEEPVVEMPPPNGQVRDDLALLAGDVVSRRMRTILLAGLDDTDAAAFVLERLLTEALAAGLSTVVVDAGSGVASARPGLSDLAADRANYGDVVQQVAEDLAEVGWGRYRQIDLQSPRPLTLVEALGDLYHLVIVDTGRVGAGSSLPAFCGGYAPVVLVAAHGVPPAAVAAGRRAASALGFSVDRMVTAHVEHIEVA